MSKLLIFVALFATVAFAQDCKYKDLTIKKGESALPAGECQRVTCLDNGGIAALPCPQIGIPQGCNVIYQGRDDSKPYPDCCGKAYCP